MAASLPDLFPRLVDIAPGDGDALLPSPCVGICEIDAADGLCQGCDRSKDEIFSWRSMSSHERALVWREVIDRPKGTSRRWRLLPWTARRLVHELAAISTARCSRWTIGPHRFVMTAAPVLHEDGLGFDAHTPTAVLTFRHGPGTRCFACGEERLVLALHRARLRDRSAVDTVHGDGRVVAEGPLDASP